MNIGIIGAGNIGRFLAKKLVSAGHRVSVSNSRGPGSLTDLAARTGVIPEEIQQTVYDKDVIVIAIPEDAVLRLPARLFSVVDPRTIFVDTGNYYPEVRDAQIAAIEGGMPESVWVSEQLGISVLKAFNAITIGSLEKKGLPAGASGRLAIPVAGDSNENKKVIFALIDEVGFDAVDAGALAESWRQQPGAPAYCNDLDRAGLIDALKKADHHQIASCRRKAIAAAKEAVEAAGGLAAAQAAAGR